MSDLENMIEVVKQGDLERVRVFLESDDRLANKRDQSSATPRHYAALNGHRQIVRLLLERGADINSIDSQFGATPTGWAIEYLREMVDTWPSSLTTLPTPFSSGTPGGLRDS